MSRPVETLARFGTEQSLAGILTTPAGPTNADVPAIVILNTGIGHRASHHRLFVIFARKLAASGYPVLRFDLSGLGDSSIRGRLVDRMESDNADIGSAISFVEALGHRQAILLGLCSGADRAAVYAGRDKRVRGLILIDPSLPPTIRLVRMLVREMTLFSMLTNFTASVRRRVRKWLTQKSNKVVQAERRGTGPLAWQAWYKLPAFLAGIYADSVANGTAILALFTSGVQGRHGYPEWLEDAFPRIRFGDLLTSRLLDGVHHLLMLEEERERAGDAMIEWLRSRWSIDEASPVMPSIETRASG